MLSTVQAVVSTAARHLDSRQQSPGLPAGRARPQLHFSRAWPGPDQSSATAQGNAADAHPALVAAIAHAAGRFGHVMFPENAHQPALDVAARLLGSVGRGWAARAFFSDDGWAWSLLSALSAGLGVLQASGYQALMSALSLASASVPCCWRKVGLLGAAAMAHTVALRHPVSLDLSVLPAAVPVLLMMACKRALAPLIELSR